MANCKNCGAALQVNSSACPYCNTRQDVDLTGIVQYETAVPQSKRICPRCHTPMPTIRLKLEGNALAERCEECMGLFLGPDVLDAVLDKAVSNVYHIDNAKLKAISNAKRHGEFPLGYIKCPECKRLMTRTNLDMNSGVAADKCPVHGIWLDGGELRQIMEWLKAGGKLLQQQREREHRELVENAKRMEDDGPDIKKRNPLTGLPRRGLFKKGRL